MFYWTCQFVWAVCLFAIKKSASKNKSWDSVCMGLIYSVEPDIFKEEMNRNLTFGESITNSIVFYKGTNFYKPSVVNPKETWKLWGELFKLLCSVSNRTGGAHNCKLSKFVSCHSGSAVMNLIQGCKFSNLYKVFIT